MLYFPLEVVDDDLYRGSVVRLAIHLGREVGIGG
jgi:hypothetical protein